MNDSDMKQLLSQKCSVGHLWGARNSIKMSSYILLITIIICAQYSLALGDKELESCSLVTGQSGKCLNISNCSYALDLLKKNKSLRICRFKGDNSRVCCIEEELQQLVRKPGDLSLSKCAEFYPFVVDPVLILSPRGKPSLPKQFPHMAAIGFGEKDNIKWQCGGSLISKSYVLTAAHCLNSRELGPARLVRLGDLDLATDSDIAEPQDFTVKRRIPHPDYKPPSRYHDIALIELDREVTLSAFVSIACLDTVRRHEEKQMTAIGWGRTAFTGEYSSILLKVNLDIVAHDKCEQSYKDVPTDMLPSGIVDDMYICAGGKEEQDTCQGDSGGPLQIFNENPQNSVNVHKIVGVTSFGKPCGISKTPGIYTRVYNYLSWIESIVWPS